MNQSQSTVEASGADSGSTPLLALKDVSKSFGAVEALKEVDLDVYAGQVAGPGRRQRRRQVDADQGRSPAPSRPIPASFGGRAAAVKLSTPHDATEIGIATVYQDLALAENLDVVANLFLGQEEANTLPGVNVLDEVAMEQKSVELLSSLGVTTLRSVRTEVAMLSGGQRQAVAIARSLLGEPKLVLLDEPTAALGIVQTEQILRLIERLRDRGLGVIVISHNLADVFEVCDRIAVLRLGRMAAIHEADDTNREQVVASMTGADVKERSTEETPL